MHLDKGTALDTGKDVHDISRLAQRVRRGEYNIMDERRLKVMDDFEEQTPHQSRKLSKKRKPLSVSDKIDIVHRVIIQHEKHADIAKEYRVRPSVVA